MNLVPREKRVPRSVSLPESLYERIDVMADDFDVSRSELMEALVLAGIEAMKGEQRKKKKKVSK